MITDSMITGADILEAKELLDLARHEGDQLKIDLREASLNDLIERYSKHVCHTSQIKEQTNARR